MHSEALCILGMHRSGTSSISRAFNLLGYYLGEDKDIINACPENPKGFWELYDIVCIHQEILHKLKLDWDTTTPVPVDSLLSLLIVEEKSSLKDLILTRLAIHKKWMWKDPRTCLLMPLWSDILREINASLKCVFVVRNPLDVARSLAKRNGFALEKGYKIWLLNNLCALYSIDGQKAAFISYEKYVIDWEGETRRATSLLNIDWPTDNHNIIKEMNEFIEPELQHSRSSTTDLAQAPVNIQSLYKHLLECTSSNDPCYKIPEAIKNMALNELK